MMSHSRRVFLRNSAAYAAAFASLARWERIAKASPDSLSPGTYSRYGELIADPAQLLDLPRGFTYKIISRAGDRMDDGYTLPGLPDGMGTFSAPNGNTILIRNHELLPNQSPGPFGDGGRALRLTDLPLLYDQGEGKTPHRGGTTTLVYDTERQQVVRQFLSLAGTARNCAGGPTPWNSWITCEETVLRAGFDSEGSFFCNREHGFNFEVPATDRPRLHQAAPLTEMGRFNHEAVAVDPRTSIVYQTEDREDGLIYRFIPNRPGNLAQGGKLQALCASSHRGKDMRNWTTGDVVLVGKQFQVSWLDLDEVQSPKDDLRYRGFERGAARFARGEGMWYADGHIYFACTNGGARKMGQIWRYACHDQGNGKPSGTLELFVEPNDSRLLESADNLTAAPWGDLIVCEDRQGDVVRLVGVSKNGSLYTLANCRARSELSGVSFSPDGTTLFVNVQLLGLTIAVTGPWS
jgi:uncharacterized protein